MASLIRKPVSRAYLDTASTNITTSAWVEAIASTGQPASGIEIFNGTGRLLEIAIGAAASEVAMEYYISPGGSPAIIPLFDFAKGVRISLKAVDATADVGLIVYNFFG